jgi:hypothetical protein
VKKIQGFVFVIASAFLLNGCYTQLMLNSDDQYGYIADPDNEPAHVCVDYGPYTNYYADQWWMPAPASGVATGGSAAKNAKTGRQGTNPRNDGSLDTPSRNVPGSTTLPTASGASGGSAGGAGGSAASTQVSNDSAPASNKAATESRTDTRNDDGKRSTNKEKK